MLYDSLKITHQCHGFKTILFKLIPNASSIGTYEIVGNAFIRQEKMIRIWRQTCFKNNGYDCILAVCLIQVICNLFGVLHDEAFWSKPYEFHPERFLTEEGKIIPVDHPNRQR